MDGQEGRPGWLVGEPPEVLDADGLLMVAWRDEDAPVVAAAVVRSREHLAPWMPWARDYRPEEAPEIVAAIRASWDAGTDFAWVVRDGDEVVGACGLHARVGEGRLELGYWTHVDRIGEGIAPRAAAAATTAAFGLGGVEAVEIRHDAANVRSARIPQKLGYRQADVLPRDTAESGGDETIVWEVTREQWMART